MNSEFTIATKQDWFIVVLSIAAGIGFGLVAVAIGGAIS